MQSLQDMFRRFLTRASTCPPSAGAKVVFVLALLAITTGARWILDPLLQRELPFFLYLPAILFAAAYCGAAAGFATLGGSLVVALYLWIPPSLSWWRVDLSIAVSLGIWFVISSVLLIAIALLQESASAQRKLVVGLDQTSRELQEKSARLEASEKQLASRAGKLEQLVAERTATLEATIAELEEFSYTISHDLRSPLRAMQGFAHLLIEEYTDRLDAAGRDYLERIDRAAQRLDALIRDLLSYSSVGRAAVELQPLDLETVIERIVSHYPAINQARSHIRIVRPLLPVLASESHLMPAVSQLIENAIKFIAPASTPDIEIRTEQFDSRVRLHVADRGLGIPPAAQAHIFKPFHRAQEAAGYPGTGIGLAIVKRAVERQGGTIGVSSEVGKGSDFWIELPLAPEPSDPPTAA